MFALNNLNTEIHGHLFSFKFDRGILEHFIPGSRMQIELRSEPLRQSLDMNATLVLDLPHLPDLESQRIYQEYKGLEERCEEIPSVERFQKTPMITQDIWEMRCKLPDVLQIIREMRNNVDRLYVAANNSRFMRPRWLASGRM